MALFSTVLLPALATAITTIGATATTAAAAAATVGGAAAGTSTALAAGGLTAAQVGGAVSVAGTVASLGGTAASLYANAQAADASREQEGLRRRQMALEAARSRRQVIRESQAQRAAGLLSQSGSGSETGGSSAYGGLVGQTSSDLGFNLNAVNQNEQIGSQLFAANAREADARGQAGLYGGISQLGQQIANPATASAFGNIFETSLTGRNNGR